eukprot:scaffold1339_cov129-Skeletonema_dohrnii-CCMP3373.AAC.5
MAYNEDSSASGHDEPWIQWFCGLKGHEMFCEVERAYIEDGFNLYGLRACYAAKEFGTCPLIQCSGQPVLPVGLKDDIGLERVKIFCPKCQSVYHPPPIRSRGVHHSSNGGGGAVDGAAFGTTFPHLFLMTFNNLMPDPLPPDSSYTPKVFGFRVHKSAWQQGRGGYPSRSNNNNNSSRRGGAYTQRRLASMTTSRVAPAAPVQQQPAANAGKDGAQDGRTGKPSVAVAGAGEASPQPVEAVKPESKEAIPGVVVEEAGANGNDSASKRKNKSDGSKNSVSPKRQKRSDAV